MKINDNDLKKYFKENYFCENILSSSRASISLIAILLAWKNKGYSTKIALCPNVCHEVLVAIIKSNFTPVFVDLDPITGIVPLSEWQIAKENGASVALVIHLYGNPANVKEVKNIFNGKDFLVIDDAAQALGAKDNGKNCGSNGDVGLLSFGYKKHIQTGGSITVVKDPLFCKKIEFKLSEVDNKNFFENSDSNSIFLKEFNISRDLFLKQNNNNFSHLHKYLKNYNLIKENGKKFDPKLTLIELKNIKKLVKDRFEKSLIWKENLNQNKILCFGLTENSSPWRFACRVKNFNWQDQKYVADEIRKNGIDVSNWYIPIHWMYDSLMSFKMNGADKLSKEIFQFWVDADITKDQIVSYSKIINKIIDKV